MNKGKLMLNEDCDKKQLTCFQGYKIGEIFTYL